MNLYSATILSQNSAYIKVLLIAADSEKRADELISDFYYKDSNPGYPRNKICYVEELKPIPFPAKDKDYVEECVIEMYFGSRPETNYHLMD